MNTVRKHLRISPSKASIESSVTATHSRGPPGSSLQHISHDALLLPLSSVPPPRGRDEENDEEGYLLVEEDATDSSLIITMEDNPVEVKTTRRRAVRSRKRKLEEEGDASETEEEEAALEVEIDRQLDQSLETKSRQHNLTTVNVRNIIHEVITNEHVVAMMKAAINETEAVPPFEPKMTRAKFKEVVEKGVVIPAWNISPIKKTGDVKKPPQFVDIPLADEDSSDEEYHPDEEDEDETAEDTFQESDMESIASSPRGSRLGRADEDSCSPWQTRIRSRRLRAGSVSMGPPPPPKAQPSKTVTDSTFLEKLHAVEEELAVCMKPYQPLSESEDNVGLMAYRTRSKRPLRDVPLGQLEAELRAPDITPDMYDTSSAHEDREWTDWLRGLMNSDMDNEEDCDDEDDPEYNFLADIDEPDLEDYRDDKAVRITKKEVNELMEELFETLKEDLAAQEVEDEGREEEEEPHIVETHTPEEEHNTEPIDDQLEDGPITKLKTVKQQLTFLRRKQHLGLHTHTLHNTHSPEPHTLRLDQRQRFRLQQQLQQHVQLLTQIHLLSSPVAKLHSEAETTRQFLLELDLLAQRGELLMSTGCHGYCSIFRASNLQGALQLLEELQQTPINYQPQLHPPDARGHMRCYPVMPAELAWFFATRPVFLYPELLPCASLDPALYCPRRTAAFTAAEDCLLVLGLRNMEGSVDPTKLASQFLLRKTLIQVRRRILQCCRPGFPDNIIKAYRYQRVLWPMAVACHHVHLTEQRPPVEREESVLPPWLARSLPVIHSIIKNYNNPSDSSSEAPPPCRSGGTRHSHMAIVRATTKSCSFPPGVRYPAYLPKNLEFRRIGFVLLQQPLLPPTNDAAPLPDRHMKSLPPPPAPSRVPLPRLFLPRNDSLADIITTSKIDMTTREQIRLHYQTLTSLRRTRSDEENDTVPAPPQSPARPRMEVQERFTSEEEEEEESEVRLALSESSSSTGSVTHNDELAKLEEVESEQEVTTVQDDSREEQVRHTASTRTREYSEQERTKSTTVCCVTEQGKGFNVGAVPLEKVELQGEGPHVEVGPREMVGLQEEFDDDNPSELEELFAQEYLLRVCDAMQEHPGVSEQLLQVLDQFSGSPRSPVFLYNSLSQVLRPWPQLLRDFAAFLTPTQAGRCGLLLEQQLFQRSRRFLQQLGRSLGEESAIYRQVVSLLQGSSAPTPEDMNKILSLLNHHPDLQEEFWEFFRQFHDQSLSTAPISQSTALDCMSQNPPDVNRKKSMHQASEERDTGSDGEEVEESAQSVCAKNISLTSNGEKIIVWTREADRTILTACKQRGANWKTFRHVSAQLGNKTAQQVSLRFQDLMKLFHSAFPKSNS